MSDDAALLSPGTHYHRRKTRKSIAAVEFDQASLGLSSSVAEQAIDEIGEHTRAIEATAEMKIMKLLTHTDLR